MTAQVTDTILIHDRLCDICGIHGDPPFLPQSLGVVPVAPHTACWRGYINRYRIYRRRLLLEQLHLYLGEILDGPAAGPQSIRAPVINGVDPRLNPIADTLAENFYDRLHLELPFTGGILAGRSFMRQLYVHMGLPPAWKFESVYEAIFEQGKLKRLRDVSPQMKEIRGRMLERPLRPDLPKTNDAELMSWIRSAFELDYDWDSWM